MTFHDPSMTFHEKMVHARPFAHPPNRRAAEPPSRRAAEPPCDARTRRRAHPTAARACLRPVCLSQAQQLKISGEATPRQIRDLRAQIDLFERKQRGDDFTTPGVGGGGGPAKKGSSACAIM